MFKLRFVAFVLSLCAVLTAQDKPAFVTKPALYPLEICIVSGEKLDDDAVTFAAANHTFRTCCEKCQSKVVKAPAKFVEKLAKAQADNQRAHYPLKTCPVSGEALGSMGKPVELMLDGMLVQLCCKSCVGKAEQNAVKMADKVRTAAFAAQADKYPLKTCVVSGEKLDDSAVTAMFGGSMARFCCKKCMAKFEKDPTPFVAKLHEAWMKSAGGEHGKDHGHEHGEGHGKEHGKEHGK